MFSVMGADEEKLSIYFASFEREIRF